MKMPVIKKASERGDCPYLMYRKLQLSGGLKYVWSQWHQQASKKERAKTDLVQFSRGSKAVEEALSIGWEMENAESDLARSKLSRVQIVYRELEGPCVDSCQGKWLEMAERVSQRNGVSRHEFSEAARNLLRQGRGKYRNVFLKGPANCGKTFR